jgi:hypothetical protein
MGQLLHGSSRPIAAVRRALRQSHESRAPLSARDHRHPKTVATWNKRTHGHDAPRGPTPPRSTLWTRAADALMVAFRTQMLRPLDDGL